MFLQFIPETLPSGGQVDLVRDLGAIKRQLLYVQLLVSLKLWQYVVENLELGYGKDKVEKFSHSHHDNELKEERGQG
jgi:hypothetical protein